MRKSGLFCMFVSALVISLCLSACGGGGGGGDASAPASSWTGPVNASGFPDVAGKYALNTSTVSYTCTNGSSGTIAPLALNLDVTQNVNQLSISNPAATASMLGSGFTLTSTTGTTGNVERNGHYILNQTLIGTLSSFSGTFTINYNLTGYFSMTGWSGNYQYIIYNDYDRITCTYTTPFTGDYVSPLAAVALKANSYEQPEQAVETIPLDGSWNDMGLLLGFQ